DESFLAWSSGVPAPVRALPEAAPVDAASSVPVVPASLSRADRVATAPRTSSPQRQEPRITVTWDKAEISDVVSGFAALSGRTIVLGKGVTGQVTAEIRDKPWSQAFQAILAAQGLSAQEMPGGIIRVDAPTALAELDSLEPLETQVVRVNYARAGELGKSIEGILTNKRGKVNADTASNSLIITDTKSRLSSIVDFARGLHILTPQVSIQAKIIFVDRTDLEQLGVKYDLGSSNQFFNKLVQRPDPNGEPGDVYPSNVNV